MSTQEFQKQQKGTAKIATGVGTQDDFGTVAIKSGGGLGLDSNGLLYNTAPNISSTTSASDLISANANNDIGLGSDNKLFSPKTSFRDDAHYNQKAASKEVISPYGVWKELYGDSGSTVSKIQIGKNMNIGNSGVGIGLTSVTATGQAAVALGTSASAAHLQSVALGYMSQTNSQDTVSVGNNTLKRRITNVQDATQDYDAVNKRQLDTEVARIKLSKSVDITYDGVSYISGGSGGWFSDMYEHNNLLKNGVRIANISCRLKVTTSTAHTFVLLNPASTMNGGFPKFITLIGMFYAEAISSGVATENGNSRRFMTTARLPSGSFNTFSFSLMDGSSHILSDYSVECSYSRGIYINLYRPYFNATNPHYVGFTGQIIWA